MFYGLPLTIFSNYMDTNILAKMQRYCAYQERAESEVCQKLVSFCLCHEDRLAILKQLRAERYFDNERFTEIYVTSKVARKWGKNKIKAGLLQKQIPEEIIQKYLESINSEENRKNLIKIATAWLKNNKKESSIPNRLYRYLYGNGFEIEDISDILKTLKTLNYKL